MLWWIGMAVGSSGVLWLLTTPLVKQRGDAELVRRNLVASSILVALGATLVGVGAPATAPLWVRYVAVVALLLTSGIVGRVGSLSDEELLGAPADPGEDGVTPLRRRREPPRIVQLEDRKRREAAAARREA